MTEGLPDAIAILPPLAIGRLGGSDHPLDAFAWGSNDITPAGTAKTRVLPRPSLVFDTDHRLTVANPDTILFKDDQGIRPVCPFFELHGLWGSGATRAVRPVDEDLVSSDRIRWSVRVANRKAENLTEDPAMAIEAGLDISAAEVGWHELVGRCDQTVPEPLFAAEASIPLGRVRIPRPSPAFRGYRLRFYPAKGHFFGPTDLKQRWDVAIPDARLFLNPRSSWSRWTETGHQPRATPQGQYAADAQGVSYGMLDDVCDGVLICEVIGAPHLRARARIVVAPPDYAPDRRPLVSVADGLKDREERDDVLDEGYLADFAGAEDEVLDLLERAFENAGLMNLDAIAEYFARQNIQISAARRIDYDPRVFFKPGKSDASDDFPLTATARRYHRRLVVRELLRDRLRREPDFVDRLVRDPLSHNTFYTRQMPAMMRGPDGRALHLTARQFTLLKRYAARLCADAAVGTGTGDVAA